jgi:hypothetical protein
LAAVCTLAAPLGRRPAQVRRHGSMKTGTQDRSRRSAVCALAASTLRARPCTRASSWC